MTTESSAVSMNAFLRVTRALSCPPGVPAALTLEHWLPALQPATEGLPARGSAGDADASDRLSAAEATLLCGAFATLMVSMATCAYI